MSGNKNIFLTGVFALLLFAGLAACQSAASTPAATATATLPLPTATPTATLAPTATPVPPTATPTNTPAPELPVALGTPIPHPSEPITAENAGRLVELARYGSPTIWDAKQTGDGSRLFVSTSIGVVVLDTKTMKRLAVFDVIPAVYSSVSPSWDGSRFLVLTNMDARIYDGDGNLVRVLHHLPENSPNAMYTGGDLSADGRRAVISFFGDSDNVLQVFDVDTGEMLFEGLGNNPVLSPDGRWLAAQIYGLALYDVETGKYVTEISLEDYWFPYWEFSPNGEYLAIALANKVVVWDIINFKKIRLISIPNSEDFFAPRVRWSPDGDLLATIYDDTRIWDIATGEMVKKITLSGVSYFGDYGWAIPFLPGPEALGMKALPVPGWGSAWSLGFANDMLFYAGAKYGTGTDGKNYVESVACTIDLNGEDRECKTRLDGFFVYDDSGESYFIETKEDRYVLQYQGEPITLAKRPKVLHSFMLLYISQTEVVYAYETRNKVRVYHLDLETRKILIKEFFASLVNSWDYNPDLKRLALGFSPSPGHYTAPLYVIEFEDDASKFLYSTSGYSSVVTFKGQFLGYAINDMYGGVESLGRLALDDGKNIWDVNPGEDYARITALQFSPDGTLLLAGLHDGRALLIDAESGEIKDVLHLHSWIIEKMAFSADGTMLATFADDGLVKIWGVWP